MRGFDSTVKARKGAWIDRGDVWRLVSVSGIALLIGISAHPATAEPTQPSAETDHAVSQILRTAPNRMALSKLLGIEETRCLQTSTTHRHCSWELRNRHAGWSELANALGTRKRINVVCELPINGSERALDACVARPRESNRWMWMTSSKSGPAARKYTGRSKPQKGATKAAYAATAQSWLANARTIAELTRLMGALPESCEGGVDLKDSQMCVWKTTRRTYGHGTVAASEQAPLSKKMILRCVVPKDGSSRDEGSCLARIGS